MTTLQPARGFTPGRHTESAPDTVSQIADRSPHDSAAKSDGYSSTLGDSGGPLHSEGPIDEIPPIFSGVQIELGGSRTGRVNTPGDADGYSINLVAGQSYVFTLTGTGANALEDPLLELYFNGRKVAMDDDAGPGRNAMIRFTATVSGTHYLNAKAWQPEEGPTLTGEYTLSAALGPPQNPLDAIDLGYSVPTTNISVYFATASETFEGITAQRSWTAAEITAAMSAMATFSAVTTLTFTQAAVSAGATFILSLAELPGNVLGQFGTRTGTGYGVFDPDPSYWSAATLQPGGLAFSTLLHEIGHGLGLAHPHDNSGVDPNNSSEIMQGVVSEFESYGTYGFNQGAFTMMSYNRGAPDHPYGRSASVVFGSESTPGPLDIALLQQKYGINTSTNAGDNVYTLVAGNGPGTRYQAIWDVGGTDAIVYSGNSPVNIDLRAATLLTAPGGAGGLSYVGGTYGGFTIANGVVIEIATSGAGDDKLWGGYGNNILTAGAGNDTLSGDAGFDTLNGGEGNDRVLFEDNPAGVTVNLLLQTATDGWGNTDTLSSIEFVTGSAFNDYIVSGLGNSAGETNSVGGAGNDYIEDHASVWGGAFGGEGNDTLIMLGAGQAGFYGEGGDDTIIGGNADDYYLWGGDGNDTIRGGGGNDGIRGGQGDDTLFGDAGNDEIDGFDGADVIFGGDGNDRLTGGYEADLLSGGRGNDIIDGGAGFDTASYEDTLLGVIVTLPTVYEGEASGAEIGVDVLIGIENVTGGAGADTLTGNQAPNILRGGDGSDLIDGGAGDDVLNGGSGVDTASYVSAAGAVTVSLAVTSAQNTGGAGTDTLSGIENLTGSAFADLLTGDQRANLIKGGADADTLSGDAGDDELQGEAGNDQLYGGTGDDLMYGQSGNDLLSAEDGNDALYGGADGDTLSGGAGDDELQGETDNDRLFGGLGDDLIYGNEDNDTLYGEDGADRLFAGAGVDLVYGGAGADQLLGEDGNDALYGGADADALSGGAGDDELQGETGNDRLFGGLGDDLIYGNEDNDTLYGEDGADVLFGGTGADIFAYANSSDGGDFIADFVGGSDSIMVRASGFGGGLAEGVAVTLRTGAAPSAIGTGGQFLYNTGSGALSWDADGVGAQAAVLIATLVGAPSLSASDIVVASAVGAGPSSIGIGGPLDEPGPVLLDDPGTTARPDPAGLSAHSHRSALAANHNAAPDHTRFEPYVLTISQDGDEPVPTHPSPAPIFLSAQALIEAAGADRDKRSMPVEGDAPLEQANLASEAAAAIASPRLPSFEPGYATISSDSDQPLVGAMRQQAFLADDDHFVFAAADSMPQPDRAEPSGSRELRPHPFDAVLLDDEATFDFSNMTAATPSDPAAGGGGQPVDFSWMDIADHPMPDIYGAPPALDGSGAVTLDYRTPDMFEDGLRLSLDGMAALGPDAFRIA